MKRQIIIFTFMFFILSSFCYAGFFDPIIDPIENLFRELKDEIRDELSRTSVGRELNRIIEDMESVARIATEFDNLVMLAESATTPVGIANLAIQYGHDPDALFERFKERVDSLEASNPEGGGSYGELSNREAAGALQSVLEEPVLPDGVYLGDSCIIDFSSCDFSNHPYRDSFWGNSCYVEGVIGKKKIGGLNRATCDSSWINTYSGKNVGVQFIHDNQHAQYYWDDCANVYLSESDLEGFLNRRRQVCSQLIGRHDVGDICLVDYSYCNPGDQTVLYNSNRIGTIVYDLIPGVVRRGYMCELLYYGRVALDQGVRRNCQRVYVGQREVDEFVSLNPEPVSNSGSLQAVEITPNPTTSGSPPTIEGIQLLNTREYPLGRLGDIREEAIFESNFVYGRNGIVDIGSESVGKKKIVAGRALENYEVRMENFSLDRIREFIVGRELPGPIKNSFRNENIHLEIRMNYGENLYYCISISEGIVEGIDLCSSEFDATVHASVSESVIRRMKEDPKLFLESEDVYIKGIGFGNNIKITLLKTILGLIN